MLCRCSCALSISHTRFFPDLDSHTGSYGSATPVGSTGDPDVSIWFWSTEHGDGFHGARFCYTGPDVSIRFRSSDRRHGCYGSSPCVAGPDGCQLCQYRHMYEYCALPHVPPARRRVGAVCKKGNWIACKEAEGQAGRARVTGYSNNDRGCPPFQVCYHPENSGWETTGVSVLKEVVIQIPVRIQVGSVGHGVNSGLCVGALWSQRKWQLH